MTIAPTVEFPKGRTRSEFEPLSLAEKALVRACRLGEMAQFGEILPEKLTPECSVRASLVRFLALGGDSSTPVHEHGVHLIGAWLVDDMAERLGSLDLEQTNVPFSLVLQACKVGQIILAGAQLAHVHLVCSELTGGIRGNGVKISGDLLMTESTVRGRVDLLAASIGGSAGAVDATFEVETGTAIALDVATIGIQFVLRNCRVWGAVSLRLLTSGRVYLDGTVIRNRGGTALDCGGSDIRADLQLGSISQKRYSPDGACFLGDLNLIGLRLGGDLVLSGGRFGTTLASFPHHLEAGPVDQAITISLNRTQIGGTLQTRDAMLNANIDLTGAKASTFDDGDWSSSGMDAIVLDGFRYDHLVNSRSTGTRTEWLKKQPLRYLIGDFRAQPWEQVAAVLRSMGDPDAAREVLIAKEHQADEIAKSSLAASRLFYVPKTQLLTPFWTIRQRHYWEMKLHQFWGWAVSYGYEPFRILPRIMVVWIIYSLIFWLAASPQITNQPYLLEPVASSEETTCLLRRIAGDEPSPCVKKAPDYNSFVAPVFALDVLLPIVNLGYKSQWRPVLSRQGKPLFWGHALQFAIWVEILIGWIAGITVAGAVAKLIRRD